VNIAELLSIPASAFPDQEILRSDGRGESYGQLLARAERVAGVLRGLGVGRGDRVAVLETNTGDVVGLLFASAIAEAAFVPLNYRARVDELAHMLAVSKPRCVFAGARYWTLAHEALASADKTQVIALEPMDNVASDSTLAGLTSTAKPVSSETALDDTGLAALLFTSGTTARSKAVMLGHQDLSTYIFSNFDMATGEDNGAVAISAPLYHIAGITSVLSATFSGRRMVLMRQFDAAEWLDLVQRERVTHAFLVPTMLKRVLDLLALRTADLSSLQMISYGAAPMPLQVIRRAIETLPPHIQFTNAFGQTETAATVTILGPEDHRLRGSAGEVELRVRRLASVGRALPGVEVRILGEDGAVLPSGQTGEIAIRSERVMRGYYGDDNATAATLKDGWLLTRDLGWLDQDGYLFLAGRKSDMIIRGGENIAPEEVEVVLAAHPAVDEVAVVGIPDVEWGEVVAAAVVLRPGMDVSASDLIAFCRQRLASFKTPERVVFVSELPRNSLGKVLRRELRSPESVWSPNTPSAKNA
jgi:acyl-CoA synthetase (AMP-forming)/AMP-acid ligase II